MQSYRELGDNGETPVEPLPRLPTPEDILRTTAEDYKAADTALREIASALLGIEGDLCVQLQVDAPSVAVRRLVTRMAEDCGWSLQVVAVRGSAWTIQLRPLAAR